MSLALNLYLDPNSFNNYGGMIATSVVFLIPAVVIFLIFPKQSVEGVATSELKD